MVMNSLLGKQCLRQVNWLVVVAPPDSGCPHLAIACCPHLAIVGQLGGGLVIGQLLPPPADLSLIETSAQNPNAIYQIPYHIFIVAVIIIITINIMIKTRTSTGVGKF